MIMAVVAVILCATFAAIAAMSSSQAAGTLTADMQAAISRAEQAIQAAQASEAAQSSQAPQSPLAEQDRQPLSDDMTPPDFTPPELGQPKGQPGRPGEEPERQPTTPIAVYTLEDGQFTAATTSSALVDADALADVTQACESAQLGQIAQVGSGLVCLKEVPHGTTLVAFASSSALSTWTALLPIFALVGAAALVVFLLASVVFARWALRPVRLAWQRQREFVANASHELRTPLSAIKANTELLLDEPSANAPDCKRWLTGTRDAAADMETLVDDMLALASLDELQDSERAGRRAALAAGGSDAGVGAAAMGTGAGAGQQGEPQPVDASRMVEGATLQFESRAFEGGFALETDIQPGVRLSADKAALQRITAILLDNACKYVDEGGCVNVRLQSEAPSTVSLQVANTGPGIPEEKLPHVFERFYRVDGSHSDQGERADQGQRAAGGMQTARGHGLGLSIAKALADQMGATLMAASSPERTVFTLTLRA